MPFSSHCNPQTPDSLISDPQTARERAQNRKNDQIGHPFGRLFRRNHGISATLRSFDGNFSASKQLE
jgi:hypothetical protein